MFIILPFFLFLLVFRVVFLFHLEIILVMRQTSILPSYDWPSWSVFDSLVTVMSIRHLSGLYFCQVFMRFSVLALLISPNSTAPARPPANGWASAPTFTPSAAATNAAGGSGWDVPPPRPRRAFDSSGYGAPSSGRHTGSGDGRWADGKHIPGPPDPTLERELFGVPNDPTKQNIGINFEKYDDIPVEASGHDVPEAVTSFTSPPLDSHLLTNIYLAHYKSPTPVQKYSIPIVMGGRDLMACAQTGICH